MQLAMIGLGRMGEPRVLWLMVPVQFVDTTTSELLPYLEPGDTLIDGGNSHYIDDIRRSKALASKGVHYVDVGTSGGVLGLERGCMMIGGERDVVRRLDPIFATLAPRTQASMCERMTPKLHRCAIPNTINTRSM